MSFTTIIIISQFSSQNRKGCLISRGDNFVITGGTMIAGGRPNAYVYNATSIVSLYTPVGFVRDLAPLKTPRHNHGCASYTDSSGEEVGVVI